MRRALVRLLTAIPLLFWVGTAAVAHFVHACAAVPVDVAADLAASEPSIQAVDAVEASFVHETVAELVVEAPEPVIAASPAAVPAEPEAVREQLFAYAGRFANPPPSAA